MQNFYDRSKLIDSYLSQCLDQFTLTPSLKEAMNYSLLAGGKRLRPVLCLSFAALFKLAVPQVLPFAAGLEMIHTYSLIHDDLPAMDNDDLRRGKPTCHKAFNEALAILAGDALLTDAFSLMLTTPLITGAARVTGSARSAGSPLTPITPQQLLAALQVVSQAAGGQGMVGGQVLDMDSTAKNINITQLQEIHKLKTGAMLQAACTSGAILGGADAKELGIIRSFGLALGTAFQIVDDILDITSNTQTLGKPQGSDLKSNKATYPKFIGLEASQNLVQIESHKAMVSLYKLQSLTSSRARLDMAELEFLQHLTSYLTTRQA